MLRLSAICLFSLIALFEGATLAYAPLTAPNAASPQQNMDRRTIISREARHEIVLLPKYSLFDWIEFEVQSDNSVVLRGQVRGFTLKVDAETAIKRIEGVTRVINQIENLPQSTEDDQIRSKAYRAIYAEDGPLFHYAIEIVPTIHIIVKNGNVTLKGPVASKSDSDIAYTKARDALKGLNVKNELTVEKQ
jgi:hyperosmotically inducible periplasmic protein